MLSVLNNKNEIIIKNSRFICFLYHVDRVEEVNKIIIDIKEKYKDATHHCYAYIIDNNNKCSDDGEPAGTAGLPILEVLNKNKLNHVLCIVVRYFGKIKLGANGLIRAYAKSVTECLKNSIVELKKGYNITIKFEYDNIKKIDYLTKDCNFHDKNYDNSITYNLDVDEKTYNNLLNSNICKLKINKNIYL